MPLLLVVDSIPIGAYVIMMTIVMSPNMHQSISNYAKDFITTSVTGIILHKTYIVLQLLYKHCSRDVGKLGTSWLLYWQSHFSQW